MTYTLQPSRDKKLQHIVKLGDYVPLASYKSKFKAEKALKEWNTGKRGNFALKKHPEVKRSWGMSDEEALRLYAASKLIRYGKKTEFVYMRAEDLGLSVSTINKHLTYYKGIL